MRQLKEHPEYLVTVDGKIFSLKTMRFMKLHFNASNYSRVYIKRKFYFVHRLVAQTYIPNPENKLEVNHMDGNKQNNMLCNLEWMTRQENITHACENNFREITETTRAAGRWLAANYKYSAEKKIILDEATGIFYEGAQEVADILGVSKRNVWRRLNGEVKNNTKFKYV